ncbi:MAG: transposase, partial [Bacteroidota bacterium]
MRNEFTAFYRGKTAVNLDFSADEISSDGALILLEKLERHHQLISFFSEHIYDPRDPFRTTHSTEKLLKQRVFSLMQGYEDANDVDHLKNDPLFEEVLDGEMA